MTWEEITPGCNIMFEVAIGSNIFVPVFHVDNVEPTQIREYDMGSHATVTATTSWTEVTDTGGTVSMLKPDNANYMFDIKAGVYPSQSVVHMMWPEDSFYGELRGKGSETDVYGGTNGEVSTHYNPTLQIFNIYNAGKPTFKTYNRGANTVTITLRFNINMLKTTMVGISENWNDWIERNTGIKLVKVSLGGLRPMPAPGWLHTKIDKFRGV